MHLQAEPKLSPLEAEKCTVAPLQPLKTLSHLSAAVSALTWLLPVWDSFQMGKMQSASPWELCCIYRML